MRKCDFIQNKIHIKQNKNKQKNKRYMITINDIFIESALAESVCEWESVHTSIYLT